MSIILGLEPGYGKIKYHIIQLLTEAFADKIYTVLNWFSIIEGAEYVVFYNAIIASNRKNLNQALKDISLFKGLR